MDEDNVEGTMQLETIKRIAFCHWKVIGPFEDPDGSGLQRTYPPEREVNFNAPYPGIRGTVEWQAWSRKEDEAPFLPMGQLLGGADKAVGFALTYVYCRQPVEAILVTGSNGASVGLVNGQELFRGDASGDSIQAPVQLRWGWNSVLIKSLSPPDKQWSLWAGLMTAQGEPVPDIHNRAGFHGKSETDKDQTVQVGDPATEWRRSKPDVVVYLPKEGDLNDGDNEHFLVFESSKSRDLLAMWTQSTVEVYGDNHIVLARSKDGIKWSEPKFIVGSTGGKKQIQASWGFPLPSKQGRLYCFYTKAEKAGIWFGGNMGRLYSDDDGEMWAEGPDFSMPCPNPTEPDWFIVWQKPFRDSKGRWMAGYSAGVVDGAVGSYFMRFDNIDEGPDIEEMRITLLPLDGRGLNLPKYASDHCPEAIDPIEMLEAAEPSVVLLPDERLFVTLNTATGHIWYSVSEDDGESWREPEILCSRDQGEPFKNPPTCCPIYPLEDGRYLQVSFNNNDYLTALRSGKKRPDGMGPFTHRRPAFIAVGEFRSDAHQPIWFSKPKQILDSDGVVVSLKGTNEIGTYTSFTVYKGIQTLWYPDRKYYLLGKFITDDLLAGITVDPH